MRSCELANHSDFADTLFVLVDRGGIDMAVVQNSAKDAIRGNVDDYRTIRLSAPSTRC